MLIRAAEISDAADIARLTGQLGYTISPSEAAARLSRVLSRPEQQFFVAEVEGRPIGWVHAAISEYVDAEPFVTIAGLVVDSEHRRKGVGRMLMERAEHWARAQGLMIVRLSSTSLRTGAHRFYEQLGYTNIKTQYSFVKSLDTAAQERIRKFVPNVNQQ